MPLTNHYDALILGGGAAGLMTAWHAGRRGKRVRVLERSKKAGRKILMAGGGRCNFTNLHVTEDNFICSNPHFVKSALNRYTAWDFIGKVIEHQIPYHERRHGQLFCDNKAKDILNLLLDECAQVSAEISLQCDIQSIKYIEGQYRVSTSQGTLTAAAVVVATGGLSIPSMGTTPFGYEIAEQFGMRVEPLRASLVPYTFDGTLKEMFSRLSGNAIDAQISFGHTSFSEALLFTHRGLSGPVVLQISNYWKPGQAIVIDLLPDHNAYDLLVEAKQNYPKNLVRTILSKHLPKSLVTELESLWWPNHMDTTLANLSNAVLKVIALALNQWEIVPAGTEGYKTAEVTLGGVHTEDLSSKTMESKTQPGLYFVGEVVDVTGHLGGFNFQWAWSSGFACAQSL
ncbi:MAG: NAD(P)/FAD-dependent oxidoreductase [Pseudomonadota bacterium]